MIVTNEQSEAAYQRFIRTALSVFIAAIALAVAAFLINCVGATVIPLPVLQWAGVAAIVSGCAGLAALFIKGARYS